MVDVTASNADAVLGDFTIITRQFWNAAESSHRLPELNHPVKHVWLIYNIGTPYCKKKEDCKRVVKLLQSRCITAMKMSDLPFNFLIGGDGRVYEARGWLYQPPAFKKFPDHGGDRIDIGFIGNRSKAEVTYQMAKAKMDLIAFGLGQKYIEEGFVTKEWNKIGEPIEDDPNKPFD